MINSYFILELIIGITGITLGILLFTSRLIIDRANSVYNRSVGIMGSAYFMLGVGTLLLLHFHPGYSNEAKNLFIQCMLPIEAWLFSAAIFSPIMDSIRFRHFWGWQSAAWGAILLVVLSVEFLFEKGANQSGVLFCVELPPVSLLIIYTGYYFLTTYKKWKAERPEVSRKQHVLYMSVWVLLNVLALVAVICAIFSDISMSHTVFVVVYAYILYIAAILYYRFLLLNILPDEESVVPQGHPEDSVRQDASGQSPKALSEPDWDVIEEKIRVWKKAGGMLRIGVTILDLSKDIGVNRTYLSHYINSRYESNFNHWINGLRIEEAQKRILEHPEISLMELAEQVGYSDMAHFSKQFKQIVGIPPSVWKKNKT